jgi:hypothetical protein
MISRLAKISCFSIGWNYVVIAEIRVSYLPAMIIAIIPMIFCRYVLGKPLMGNLMLRCYLTVMNGDVYYNVSPGLITPLDYSESPQNTLLSSSMLL